MIKLPDDDGKKLRASLRICSSSLRQPARQYSSVNAILGYTYRAPSDTFNTCSCRPSSSPALCVADHWLFCLLCLSGHNNCNCGDRYCYYHHHHPRVLHCVQSKGGSEPQWNYCILHVDWLWVHAHSYGGSPALYVFSCTAIIIIKL